MEQSLPKEVPCQRTPETPEEHAGDKTFGEHLVTVTCVAFFLCSFSNWSCCDSFLFLLEICLCHLKP